MPGSDWEQMDREMFEDGFESEDRDAEIQDALRIKMLEEEIQRFTNLEGQKVETMQQEMAESIREYIDNWIIYELEELASDEPPEEKEMSEEESYRHRIGL